MYINDETSLTLSRRRAIIHVLASKFEKLPRAWFCSNQRQISAENRTVHAVHCQREIVYFFQKGIIYNTVNMLTSKKCKKAFFELIFTYEDNNFSFILF
jgi:hypothetical protein